MPRIEDDKVTPTLPRPLVVAHRGRHREHLENTLEAFRAAYEAGCDMVEFDVQLSRDGVPVIFHDDDCRRLAGRSENVFDLDWRDLAAMKLRGQGGRAGGAPEQEYRIPSLEEFLSEFGARAFYLELKVPEAKAGDAEYFQSLGERAAALVGQAHPHAETFLASFHGGVLAHLAAKRSYPRLGGIFETYERFLEVYSGKDREVTAAIRYFSVSQRIFRRFLRDDYDANRPQGTRDFLVWDIEGEKDFRAAMAQGVYGLVTDDLETLLRTG